MLNNVALKADDVTPFIAEHTAMDAVCSSASFLAEISVRSPRKLHIFIM